MNRLARFASFGRHEAAPEGHADHGEVAVERMEPEELRELTPEEGRGLRWALVTTVLLTLLLVWSALPIQPLIRRLVRPHGLCPGMIALRSPVAKRIRG